MMDKFGIGRATGIDLEGEQAGTMYAPGDGYWSESQLGTNAFGQGVAVTPLQMVTAVGAIANGGLMMQPRVIHQVIDGDQVIEARPANLGCPISAETAREVTPDDGRRRQRRFGWQGAVPAIRLPVRPGRRKFPTPIGYELGTSIASFIGFFPADDPQVIVLVKLDRPDGYWGRGYGSARF